MRMEQKVSELENTLSEVWMLIGDSLDTSTQKISGRYPTDERTDREARTKYLMM